MILPEKLGFSETTKLVIIHADDAGLSHSENMATIQLLEKRTVNSYSIMVTCPWFDEIANFAIQNPQFDYGIHLTLTCEWENYRFGSVLPPSEVQSLVDNKGHFYKKREALSTYASANDVKKELQAQIEKALEFGLNPTHIDSHMYSAGANPEFFKIYKDLGKKYRLPVLLNRQLMEMVGLKANHYIEQSDWVIEKVHMGEIKYLENGGLSDYYKNVLDNLICGLNIIIIHPAFDDDEMKGITINHPNFGSKWRQTDYDFFASEYCKAQLENENIALITWNDLKKATRSILSS